MRYQLSYSKRIFDLFFSVFGLVVAIPIIIVSAVAVWLSDRNNPFYVSERIGLNGVGFKFYKIRTMVPNAASCKVDTTTDKDPRLLNVGRWIRALKFDELPQFINVIFGGMSLVGPRPNVRRETDIYTQVERIILNARPGITDYSSIVFSDLGSVLSSAENPNLAYNQLIRPWKSRLAIHYVQRATLLTDICIVFITIINMVNRSLALQLISKLLEQEGADPELVLFVLRDKELRPKPPPGSEQIVSNR